MRPPMNKLARLSLLMLALMGGAAMAAPVCEIDPVSHKILVLESDTGRGGIGGTGSPATPALSAKGTGGIGGSGAPTPPALAANGSGGIGGTGAPVRVPFAGRVMFAHGTVLAENSVGGARKLSSGQPVCEGDSIDAGQDSLVQLAMADGGRLDLRSHSRLHLDRFVFPDNMDGSERFSATLAWGSVHAITGSIGHLHKELYALHTPLAQIGVRGTSHEVFHVPRAQPGVAAGTYNRVLTGGTTLSSSSGSLDLDPSQSGFVPLGGGAPQLLPHLPAALIHSTVAQTVSNQLNSADDAGAAAIFLKPLNKIVQNVDTTTQAPRGSAYVGSSQDLDGNEVRVGGAINHRRNRSVIVLDPIWGLPSAVADTSNGFNFFTTDVNILYDFGFAKVDGVDVIWGLYGGGNDVDPNSGAIRNVDFHHFAYAPGGITHSAILNNLSGTATFGNLVGSTILTDETGGAGGKLNALQIGVQFGPQIRITSYQLNANDSQARTWDAQFNGSVDLSTFRAGKLPLTVQCSGTGCGSGTGTGSAAGVIIGNSGKGIITSYGLQTNTGQQVGGAAVVSRP
ncbi:metal-dependent amidase [Aquitalea magnusonii]|uniref:Metal-dependent amidase n=2 Tax=Aquitalea magnusonii TaxID=332411 RepID=A0A3G9GBH4_9NEIS|nr:metal-dependent amidase [Aquitalea magnusonii]